MRVKQPVSYRVLTVLRPLLRRLPRGGKALYLLAGGGQGGRQLTAWSAVPVPRRVIWDARLRCYVITDLDDWLGRRHYFLGRHDDLANQLLIRRVLGPGDTYIDIGANRGLHSLYASRIVGPEGHVFAFEPNPQTFALLTAHLRMNRISNCTAIATALGDRSGELVLSARGTHDGAYSLRPLADARQGTLVRVDTGDAALSGLRLSGKLLVKIDVEGYEHRVLRGMSGLLARDRIVVTIEVTDKWLRELGSSAQAVFADMASRGYSAWLLGVGHRWGLYPKLSLTRLHAPMDREQYNVVFARPGAAAGA